jgi:hypothetical protein
LRNTPPQSGTRQPGHAEPGHEAFVRRAPAIGAMRPNQSAIWERCRQTEYFSESPRAGGLGKLAALQYSIADRRMVGVFVHRHSPGGMQSPGAARN